MHVHVKAKRGIGVTVGTPGKDVAHVAALCQACEAGMTLEPFGDLAGVEPAVREEPQQQSGVDRPGAGGHADAVEWREAHRGVDGSPVDDGAERRAAAEVAVHGAGAAGRSEEHTSELQAIMGSSYADF